MQAWPVFKNLTKERPLAARTGLASLQTIKGACPPSSKDTRIIDEAASRASILPTGVDPVKVSFATRLSVVKTSPTGFGSLAVTKLTTPSGIPASSASFNISTAHKGVSSAGFITMVHPAAKDGAIFRVIMDTG